MTRKFPPSDLVHLQCPFEQPDAPQCKTGLANNCPFGHQASSAESDATPPLRHIPDFFCLDHLQNRCHRIPSGYEMIDSAVPPTWWCKMGFHPASLQDFDRIVAEITAQKIMENDNSCCAKKQTKQLEETSQSVKPALEKPTEPVYDPRADPTASCKLCFKLIGYETQQPFGLLENCTHSFCYNCISQHQNKTQSGECPACATVSQRILIWPFWMQSTEMRVELLDALQWSVGSINTTSKRNLLDLAILSTLVGFCGALILLNILK